MATKVFENFADTDTPPAEPEAFRWVDVPEFMPDHDITIYAQYVG